MKRSDIIASPGFKRALEQYGIGTLKNNKGANASGPVEAKQIAAQSTGQSYNDAVRSRKKADRYGITKKEIQEGERSSSPW